MKKIFEKTYAGTTSTIRAVGIPGPGGGYHEYIVDIKTGAENPETSVFRIHFQKGHAKEVGINGLHNEHLLAMIIHNLEGYQTGPYACPENANTLSACKEALGHMRSRTRDRANRGVDGKNQA